MTGDRSRPVPESRDATSGVRHDLRHELATLRTLLAAAGADSALAGGKVGGLVATAHEEVGFALDLLDALPIPSPRARVNGAAILASRPARARLQYCDADGVLRAAVRATAPRGRIVTVDSAAGLHVALPRTDLTRIVRNLLGNALAATESGGSIHVLARRDDDPSSRRTHAQPARTHVRLEFHDGGPGPGRRGFHRRGGLGLDVVRSLVLPAGGWLVLGASAFGGACAAVTLPASAETDR